MRYATPSSSLAGAQPRTLPRALSGSLCGGRCVYSHSVSAARSAAPTSARPLAVASVRPRGLFDPLLIETPAAVTPSPSKLPYPGAVGTPYAVQKRGGGSVVLASAPGARGAPSSAYLGHMGRTEQRAPQAAPGRSITGRAAGGSWFGRAPSVLLPAIPGGLSEAEQSSPHGRAAVATVVPPSAAHPAPPSAAALARSQVPPAAHSAVTHPRVPSPRESSASTPSSGSNSGDPGAAVSRSARLQVGRLWQRLPLPAFPWCTGAAATAGAEATSTGAGTVQLSSMSAASAPATAVPLAAQRGVVTALPAASSGATQLTGGCVLGDC
jgi:hypothetical protein